MSDTGRIAFESPLCMNWDDDGGISVNISWSFICVYLLLDIIMANYLASRRILY